MDRAFDCLNSKSAYGKWNKSPLRPDNITKVTAIFQEFKDYLLTLQDSSKQPLYATRRKTFIIGFVCTFQSVLMLANELFAEGLKYFPTFRISQDFIETLFSKIRRMGGHNTNPTAPLFKAALRKLLCKQSIDASSSANAIECDTNSGIFSLEWSKRRSPLCSNTDTEMPDELVAKLQSLSLSNNVHKDNIVTYIAGYVVRSLSGKVKCDNCLSQLISASNADYGDHKYATTKNANSSLLVNVKDRGGLVHPSEAVVSILNRCEQVLILYLDRKFMLKDNVAELLMALVFRSFIEDRPKVLFNHTCELEEGSIDHSKQLIRDIALKFIDIRLKYYVKRFNKIVVQEGKGKERTNLSRLVIFKHQ